LTEEGYKEILTVFKNDSRSKINAEKEGWNYCFLAKGLTQDGSNWLKIGRAENYRTRISHYSGPAQLRKLIGIFEVDNMKKAEDHMLDGFRRVFENCNREWFIVPQDRLPEAKKLFYKLFESL
jgi:hypothetical protein